MSTQPIGERATDVRVVDASITFRPIETRVPLKFGGETLTSVTCARARVEVEDRNGNRACGWGETPISVQWVWPSSLPYAERLEVLLRFGTHVAEAWGGFSVAGHPMEVGYRFLEEVLPGARDAYNRERGGEPMPWLAALVCCSPLDQALHDAYGEVHGVPTYQTYNADWMAQDLARFLEPATNSRVSFAGTYPSDYLIEKRPDTVPVWHLVGGLDWLEEAENDGSGPDDGYPLTLREWIRRDGLACLKIKLRGTNDDWDYERLKKVGAIAREEGALWLSADFNCTVTDPEYVNAILDRLMIEDPLTFQMILYVEQPFPYDLHAHQIDAHSCSARKPLFMDESAHDWRVVREGRALGWTGVALKTCKTQTGAILSLCWARAHGMTLMVQDLTNPMLAQVPHALLAAHAGTIMGVESNAMQFYPDASAIEARIHPGLYRRRNGVLDLRTLGHSGFGYRIDELYGEPPAR